jgi:hypothetical protein
MKPKIDKKKIQVEEEPLSSQDKLRENLAIGLCFLTCFGLFIKILFF